MTSKSTKKLSDIRSDFLLDSAKAHFDWMIHSSHPEPVRAKIDELRECMDKQGSLFIIDQGRKLDRDVAEAAASYLGLAPEGADLIAQTESTTMGLALVYNGLRIAPGQEVLTTDHAFYSTRKTLEQRSLRDGLRVRSIRLFRDARTATQHEMVDRLAAAVEPETRILGLTWVHSNTGVKIPVRQIRKRVDEINSRRPENQRLLIVLDGVHGFGVENQTFSELGCDIFIAGCHKWLFGPRGTGIVCATREAWAWVDPLIPSFIGGGAPAAVYTRGGIHGYEHRWATAEAFRYHQEVLGKARVQRHTRRLTTQLKVGLEAIDTVRLVTPQKGKLSAAIVCFDIDAAKPGDVVKQLRERGVVATRSSSDADGNRHIRLSVSALNRPKEIKRALKEIETLAKAS